MVVFDNHMYFFLKALYLSVLFADLKAGKTADIISVLCMCCIFVKCILLCCKVYLTVNFCEVGVT